MTFETFDVFQQELISEVLKMRDTKGKEYSHSEDRFANFNRLATGLGIPNYQIGWVYCKKHLDSIESFMKDGKIYSNETIRSRFVDTITYLTLIAGMVEETELARLNQMNIVLEKSMDNLVDKNVNKHQPFEYDPVSRPFTCPFCAESQYHSHKIKDLTLKNG